MSRSTADKHPPAGNAVLGDRYARIGRVAVALFALAIVAAFAFGNLFTTFILWDDEGYFLQAYRDFLSGGVLYDRVFAIYGPLTFYSAALVARFNEANVTHDTFRWILLPVWTVVAALMGGLVWRWTHRFVPSILTILLVGLHLRGLAKSVGHPQSWVILVVAVLLWLGLDSGSSAGKRHNAFWAGVIIGAILLLKINIGILVFIGFALPMSLLLKRPAGALLTALLTLAAGAIGVALFFWSPTIPEKCFALVYAASLAATLSFAIGRPVQERSLTTLKWLSIGLVLSVCVVVGATLAGGTTLRGLYSAYVTMPALLARNYHGPFLHTTRKGSILISTIGLVAAVAVFRWRSQVAAQPAWLGLLKASAGAGLLCAFCYDLRLTLPGSLLFLWLLVVDLPPLSGPAYSNRLMLALLSPLFALQLVPMAGEQVDWAALLPMTAAAVLLADGMNYIARESGRVGLPRLTAPVTAATAILLTTYLFAFVAGDAFKRIRFWSNSPSVNLPGANWLRIPPKQSERLRLTVSGLTGNCQTVLMVPGLYSFSIWSGVPPFEEKRINSWPFLWPDEVRNNELRKLRDQPSGCVLVSKDAYKFFQHFGSSQRADEPLLPEIQQTMKPIYTIQDVTLYRFLK